MLHAQHRVSLASRGHNYFWVINFKRCAFGCNRGILIPLFYFTRLFYLVGIISCIYIFCINSDIG